MTVTNIADIVGSGALVVGAMLVIFSTRTKETIKAQAILINTQKERLDLLESQHLENARLIGELSGQLSAYKDLPLKQIAESMGLISATQKSIIELLHHNGFKPIK
jgi:hypothetical protein